MVIPNVLYFGKGYFFILSIQKINFASNHCPEQSLSQFRVYFNRFIILQKFSAILSFNMNELWVLIECLLEICALSKIQLIADFGHTVPVFWDSLNSTVKLQGAGNKRTRKRVYRGFSCDVIILATAMLVSCCLHDCDGIGKSNKMFHYFLFSTYHITKLQPNDKNISTHIRMKFQILPWSIESSSSFFVFLHTALCKMKPRDL